ncbi:N-acetyltransferase family protein [Roseomonas sp. OT10]|uniref:GNAT family N-acetyltransferase n=1 Tax=Roseomonas cutis TaxID=2897332 RepID=UPI001E382432|nr:GNAT family N-acetyltransferase [Roseomonas sp. OT10]UFN46997.1 N-acetyltransferase family protein [Roseomonas sp. OT10]
MPIRDAADTDIPAIAAIYAHHVLHGTGTFEETPPDEAEMGRRLAKVREGGWAWLVAEDDAGDVVGYAYYAPFHPRSAYRFAAEDSIYVRDDVRGQGVGKALVAELLARAERAGFRQMMAVIGDSENIGSIGLHVSLGFRQTGVLKAVGLKFGRWIDVVYMQRALGEGERSLPSGS